MLAATACGDPPAPAEPARAGSAAPLDPLAAPMPLEPQIHVGHLANGLTYYVMNHASPPHRAQVWLAVDAGSVLEDDDQRGVAHFVEHLTFEGTKQFSAKAIVDFIEQAGMDFGADTNAYTTLDETVYQFTLPTDDHAVLGKGFQILHDLAGGALFEPAEIAQEGPIVVEEWRSGRDAARRVREQQWPVLVAGSRYAERLVLGRPEALATMPRDAIVRFYADWYRPDNIAVIAVGDFAPAEVEQMIQRELGDLRNPPHERPHPQVAVPVDRPSAVAIARDAELAVTRVTISQKLAARRRATKGDYRRALVETVFQVMLDARLFELAEEPDSPIQRAESSVTNLVRSVETFELAAIAKEGESEAALRVLITELTRVANHGFVATELDRARRAMLAQAETDARDWDKAPASDIADQLLRHHLEHVSMAGPVAELAAMRELISTITLAELQQVARGWSSDAGRVVDIQGFADARYPTEAEVRRAYHEAETSSPGPWVDADAQRTLLPHPPPPGAILAETRDPETGTTTWDLSNGTTVVVKPTTFKNDEVVFDGWRFGGTSRLSAKDYAQVRFPGLIAAMGVAELDVRALRKVLAGHVVDVQADSGELSDLVSGTTRPADLETMLQLAYLRITAPRLDRHAFEAWKNYRREHTDLLAPEAKFWEELTGIETNHHPRRMEPTWEMLDEVDPVKALAVYRKRFADVAGFTFTFTGNVDLAQLRPLVETYLASLPASGTPPHWKDLGVRYARGPIWKIMTAGTEPRSTVSMTSAAADTWSLDTRRDAEVLSRVLELRLRELLREELGGVYEVEASATLTRLPVVRRELQISFTCAPAQVAKLQRAVLAELARIARDGIDERYLQKVREQLRREHETAVETNTWWSEQLHEARWLGEPFTALTDVNATIARATTDHVQAAVARFWDAAHLVSLVLRPEKPQPRRAR